jgi:hypothetical protein
MTDDPVQQAINVGIVSGIIVGLLRQSPVYVAVVEPLLALFGISSTQLAADALTAIANAQATTIAQGYHVQWDADNPAAPPYFVDKEGHRV